MKKKFPIFLAAAAAGALVLASATAAAQTTASKGADATFAMNAAKGGLMEVEMGRMAADHATNPDVKQFAQRMVTDHTKANDELKSIASQKGITLPTSIDASAKAKMDKMAKMSGDAFDKAYMDDMLKDHKHDVAEFRKEANGGKDADIKGFAGKTLPTLEEHLKMAEDTHAKVAGKSASTTKSRSSASKSSGSSQ
jgi:putative membrane protein